jgi:hypothetical protein
MGLFDKKNELYKPIIIEVIIMHSTLLFIRINPIYSQIR